MPSLAPCFMMESSSRPLLQQNWPTVLPDQLICCSSPTTSSLRKGYCSLWSLGTMSEPQSGLLCSKASSHASLLPWLSPVECSIAARLHRRHHSGRSRARLAESDQAERRVTG